MRKSWEALSRHAPPVVAIGYGASVVWYLGSTMFYLTHQIKMLNDSMIDKFKATDEKIEKISKELEEKIEKISKELDEKFEKKYLKS